MNTIDDLIRFYNLLPHPEGGYYKETYRSDIVVGDGALPNRFTGSRSCSTAIYFLLHHDNFSAFHRIKSDEIWHFYAGSPLHVYVIDTKGELSIIKLGNDIQDGQTYQAVVKAGCWFASRCADNNGFSFVGCTVSPGFDFADFELADRQTLTAAYPQHTALIAELTR